MMSEDREGLSREELSREGHSREGHGWWPYVVPYVAFMLMTMFGGRLPEAAAPYLLGLKPAIVLGIVIWFRAGGAYPEWRGAAARIGVWGGLQDIAVGLALTAVWVAPFILFPGLRPEPGGEFDAAMAGEEWIGVILLLRLFGYALVTPIFEELFIRNFVMRIADVYDQGDFRDQPLARYTLRSMIATTVIFTVGHVPWEWGVCVLWIVLSNLWFYHRKSLSSIMLVHGVTNAALLWLAIYAGDWFTDADGTPFSFWFFV